MSTVIQRSFAYGELAPEMRAKADLNAYSLGLKTARNVVVGKAGGIFNRPGTISLTKNSPAPGTDAHILGKIGNYLVVLVGAPFTFVYDDTGTIGSSLVNSFSSLFGYPLDGEGDRINGFNPPYKQDEIKDVSVTGTDNGFLLCHENYAPIEVYIDESGSAPIVSWRSFAQDVPTRTQEVRVTLGLETRGTAGTTKYSYAVTEVNERGFESSTLLSAEIGSGNRRLDAQNYVEISLQFADSNGDPVSTSIPRTYNIYKMEQGEFRLLDVVVQPRNETDAIEIEDIGQPLGEATLPQLRPDISPTSYVPEFVTLDANDPANSLENASIRFSRTSLGSRSLQGFAPNRDPRVGDKVAIFARYQTPAGTLGNQSITSTGIYTIEGVVSQGLAGNDVTFVEDLTPLFPNYATIGNLISISDNQSGVFLQGDNPRLALQFQDRQLFASTDNNLNTLWLSKIGVVRNFSRTSSLNESSAFSFNIRPTEGGSIQSLLDINGLYVFGSEAIWRAYGNEAGVITPTQINLREVSNFGASALPALKVGHFAFIEQQGGGIIRALSPGSYAAEDSSSDVSLFSNHFVRDNRIISWTFAKRPVPIVWMVRDDGVLLSLTFESSQGISAWCKHDIFRGLGRLPIEANDVKSIDGETYVAAVRRGDTLGAPLLDRIHIMKIDNRFSSDNPVFTDNSMVAKGQSIVSAVVGNYEGRAVDSNNLSRINLNTSMSEDELNAIFPATSVGNYIFYEDNGEYYADRVASVDIPNHRIVVERKVARTSEIGEDELILGVNYLELPREWFFAVDSEFSYSVVGDGELVASGIEVDSLSGMTTYGVTLPRGYREVSVGHPFTSDIETLDIDLTGPTISQSFKKITEVNAYVDSTLGLYAGNSRPVEDGSVNGLALFRPDRKWENNGALEASEGLVSINIDPTWNSSGAVFIRQIDPLPLAIYSISPSGSIPSPGSGGI